LSQKSGFLFRTILLSLCLAFFHISSGHSFDKKTPVKIPPHSPHPPALSPKGESGFCTIQYDKDSVAFYFPYFDAGDGIAVYMDPEFCGFDSTYPFKLTNVHFYLHHPGAAVWPVEIKVNIVSVDTTEDTLSPGTFRPGSVFHYKTFTIEEDSAYNVDDPTDAINLTLDTVFCVYEPFFLEIVYTGGTEPSYPSLVMSDSTEDRPDTNHNWLLMGGDYYEWYEAWMEYLIPGRAIIRVTGYPDAIDCNICWYWKPKVAQTPGGMPDLDQYQFGSDSALCGPTAVANCLVWLNAIPSISEPDSLIRLLSYYFHTDPSGDGGTLVDSVEAGLDSLFEDYSLNLYHITFKNPTFAEMKDSLKKVANIVLLLGLWQRIEGTWYRTGGHYVSMAGVCELNSWLAISDPGVDHTEAGAKGRILPPHDPHPDDHTLHNTKGFVSHDAYVSDTLSVDPDTGLWRIKDCEDESLPWLSQFEGQNFQAEQLQYAHAYHPTESLYAVVEYAIMIGQKPTLVAEEDVETPRFFELFQSFPNPFNNHTVIKYSLSKPSDVSLVIYNILGQKVRTLVRKAKQSGLVTVIWDGKDDRRRDLSSGIYFYRLQAGKFGQTKRMVLLK